MRSPGAGSVCRGMQQVEQSERRARALAASSLIKLRAEERAIINMGLEEEIKQQR